jgi:hypothetical protein
MCVEIKINVDDDVMQLICIRDMYMFSSPLYCALWSGWPSIVFTSVVMHDRVSRLFILAVIEKCKILKLPG